LREEKRTSNENRREGSARKVLAEGKTGSRLSEERFGSGKGRRGISSLALREGAGGGGKAIDRAADHFDKPKKKKEMLGGEVTTTSVGFQIEREDRLLNRRG